MATVPKNLFQPGTLGGVQRDSSGDNADERRRHVNSLCTHCNTSHAYENTLRTGELGFAGEGGTTNTSSHSGETQAILSNLAVARGATPKEAPR